MAAAHANSHVPTPSSAGGGVPVIDGAPSGSVSSFSLQHELQWLAQHTRELFEDTVKNVDAASMHMQTDTTARQHVESQRDACRNAEAEPSQVQWRVVGEQMTALKGEFAMCSTQIAKLQQQMDLLITQGVSCDNKPELGLQIMAKDVEGLRGLFDELKVLHNNGMRAREDELNAIKAKLLVIETQQGTQKHDLEQWDGRCKGHLQDVRFAVCTAFRQCIPAISQRLTVLKDAQDDLRLNMRRSRESLNSRILELERRCSATEQRLLESLNIQSRQFESFKVEQKQAEQKQVKDTGEKFCYSDHEKRNAEDELEGTLPREPKLHNQQNHVSYLSKDFGERSTRQLVEIENQIAEHVKRDLAISEVINEVGGNFLMDDVVFNQQAIAGSTSSNPFDVGLPTSSVGAKSSSETFMQTGAATSSMLFSPSSEKQSPRATSIISMTGMCQPNSGDATMPPPDSPTYINSASTPKLPLDSSKPIFERPSIVQQSGRGLCHEQASSSTPRLTRLVPRTGLPTPSPISSSPKLGSSSPLQTPKQRLVPKMVWPTEGSRLDRSRSARRTFEDYGITWTSRQMPGPCEPSRAGSIDSSPSASPGKPIFLF